MMKITGPISNRDYDVTWQSYGWSYAVPIIHRRVKFLNIKLWWTEKVLPHKITCYNDAAEMTPNQLQRWFQDAIDRFERYHQSWNNLDKINTEYK